MKTITSLLIAILISLPIGTMTIQAHNHDTETQDIQFAKYIEETYNLLVSLEQVDRLKLEICSLFENYSATMEIMGINKKIYCRKQ